MLDWNSGFEKCCLEFGMLKFEYLYICFPTLDAGLPLGEGVRGAAAQLTYMADMGVISIEEARRRMRILYAVRASQIYGNLNHLDNDFVSYMV